MAHIRSYGAGPDGFESGQSVEYYDEAPDGPDAWVPAVIDWKFHDSVSGRTGWVLRLLDQPSSTNMQSVTFGSALMRAFA